MTVVIAVCGLSLVGIDFLAVMGFASAISVIFAVFSTLTLLPALISIFHKRIKVNKLQSNFKKILIRGLNIISNALAAVLLGLIILLQRLFQLVICVLAFQMTVLNQQILHRKAYDIISDKFGEGFNGQIPMLINVKDKKMIHKDYNKIYNLCIKILKIRKM